MGSKFKPKSLEDYKQVKKIFEFKNKKTSKHSALQYTVCALLTEKYDFDGVEGREASGELPLPSRKMSSEQFINYFRKRLVENKKWSETDEPDAPKLKNAPRKIDVIGIRDGETIGCEINRPNSGTSPQKDAERLMKFPFTYRFLILENSNQYTRELKNFEEVIVTNIKNFHKVLEETLTQKSEK